MAEVLQNPVGIFKMHLIRSRSQDFVDMDAIQDAVYRKHQRVDSCVADPESPCPSFTPQETTRRIVDILDGYRLLTNATKNQLWQKRDRVSAQVLAAVQDHVPLNLILPGFPFKSPNKTAKVHSHLPDKAEEVALQHLNGLCASIEDIYPVGVFLHIMSDGPMYNDLLDVSDEEVWQYGHSLREVAQKSSCEHIKFIKFAELLDDEGSNKPWCRDTFLAKVSSHREALLERYTPAGFDIDAYVKRDNATTMRYRGCIKFLEKDLELSPKLSDLSKSQRKKAHGVTAKAMLLRGECFASAVAAKFGTHIRLSVHASGSEAEKLSVSMLPVCGPHETTPWHNTFVQEVDGSMSMAHKEDICGSSHTVIHENGHPSYLRAKSTFYEWPEMDVLFTYLYPRGVIIRPAVPSPASTLRFIHMQKVLGLAEQCSPVILRGFSFPEGYRSLHPKSFHDNEESLRAAGLTREPTDVSSREDELILSGPIDSANRPQDGKTTNDKKARDGGAHSGMRQQENDQMGNTHTDKAKRLESENEGDMMTTTKSHDGQEVEKNNNMPVIKSGANVADGVTMHGDALGDQPHQNHKTNNSKNGIAHQVANGAVEQKLVQEKTNSRTHGKTHGRFQLFTCPTEASKDGTQMLFISSASFFQHVSPGFSHDELSNLAWICQKPGSGSTEKQPLTVKHPGDGRLCLRLPDGAPPVGIARLGSDNDGDQNARDYTALVETMVNDRRVFTQCQVLYGDVVVCDKFNAAHVGAIATNYGEENDD